MGRSCVRLDRLKQLRDGDLDDSGPALIDRSCIDVEMVDVSRIESDRYGMFASWLVIEHATTVASCGYVWVCVGLIDISLSFTVAASDWCRKMAVAPTEADAAAANNPPNNAAASMR